MIPFFRRGRYLTTALALLGAPALCASAWGQDEPPRPPSSVQVADAPNDNGTRLMVTWQASPDDGGGADNVTRYQVTRIGPDGERQPVARPRAGTTSLLDVKLATGQAYQYEVVALSDLGPSAAAMGGPGVPAQQWYHLGRTNVLVGIVLIFALVGYNIFRAQRGAELYVRPIAGLEAVDDAVGRATEMGRPILYVSGLTGISDIATIAGMIILGRVARRVAEYETRLIVPCNDPIVMSAAREIVREAYLEKGKPDLFDPDSVFFVTDAQFGYAAAVSGMMMRERPAANFFMGGFFAESLILAETGAMIGAIQIAGTDQDTQLPFFITACDYTLMGEELYAATAYLSQEPRLLGSLKGQDWCKLVIMGLLLLGAGLVAGGIGEWYRALFQAQ